MPFIEYAKYGIAFFAVGGMMYIFNNLVTGWINSRKTAEAPDCASNCDRWINVVENNTKAVEAMTSVVQDMRTVQAVQGEQLKQILGRG